MHLDRRASVSLVLPLLRAGVLRSAPGIPILMYHSISDNPEAGVSPYYRLTTSPARFREQMQWLRRYRFTVLDLSEAVVRIKKASLDSGRYVVLTFDDGFQDFFDHAWPVLSEYNFPATVFLSTGYIGNSRRSLNGRHCLTWSEVRELHRLGVAFGSHTVTHPRLHELSASEIGRELRDSRLHIESHLHCPVRTFAYPFAFPQEDRDFASRFRQELVTEGYSAAVTTVIGRLHVDSDSLCLKRLPVSQADDDESFASKLHGAYDWLGRVQLLVRRARMRARRLRGDQRRSAVSQARQRFEHNVE